MVQSKTAQFSSLCLLRFSEACWHSDTIKSETLRFTPIKTWRESEGKDDARGDAWEGASRVDQAKNIKSVKLRFDQDLSGKWIEHELVNESQVVIRGTQTDFPATHGICFNMLTDLSIAEAISSGEYSIDLSRFREEFGPSLLVIQDVERFIDLVILAIRSLNNKIDASSHGPVEYIDPKTHSGKYNIYMKPNRFHWQCEFRIVVSNQSKYDEPFFLHVPQLQSVCQLIVDFEPNIQLIKNDYGSNSVSISQITSTVSSHC